MEERGIQLLNNGAMRMSSVRTDDAGMYECVASSVAGNASKVIELIIQSKMKNLSSPEYNLKPIYLPCCDRSTD